MDLYKIKKDLERFKKLIEIPYGHIHWGIEDEKQDFYPLVECVKIPIADHLEQLILEEEARQGIEREVLVDKILKLQRELKKAKMEKKEFENWKRKTAKKIKE